MPVSTPRGVHTRKEEGTWSCFKSFAEIHIARLLFGAARTCLELTPSVIRGGGKGGEREGGAWSCFQSFPDAPL